MKAMINKRLILFAASALAFLAPQAPAQGPLNPPGAPAQTYKTLQEIFDEAAAAKDNATQAQRPGTGLKQSTAPSSVVIVGVPFSTSASGAYYLAQNFTANGAVAITLNADNVTLDLNGFTVATVGGASAIAVTGARKNIVIRNGAATGGSGPCVNMATASASRIEEVHAQGGATGISIGANSIVRKCVATSNTGVGIVVGSGGSVEACAAASNSGDGYQLGAGCVVSQCTAGPGNGGDGFEAGNGAAFNGCASFSNSGNGFLLTGGGTIVNCTGNSNTLDGFKADSNFTIQGCVASTNNGHGIEGRENGVISRCTSHNNQGSGVQAQDKILILENFCRGNGRNLGGAAGIWMNGARNRCEGNVVEDNNDTGIRAVGSGNIFVRNFASGNLSANYNPSSGSSSLFGTIITSAGGEITSTNPWANFAF